VARKGPGGRPLPAPVTIGVSDGAQVEVVAGVREGATLLISTRAVPPSTLGDTGSPFVPKTWRNQRRGGGGRR
jgi:hypothetical protein